MLFKAVTQLREGLKTYTNVGRLISRSVTFPRRASRVVRRVYYGGDIRVNFADAA